jgi:hypothetical protein
MTSFFRLESMEVLLLSHLNLVDPICMANSSVPKHVLHRWRWTNPNG